MNDLTLLEQPFKIITQSSEQYPVDFDDAWQWVGYTRKDNALKVLIDGFDKEQDYSLILRNRSDGKPGKPYNAYFLTVDCFKSFCMMAGTERGKEVRKYYLAVEKAFLTHAKTNVGLTETQVTQLFEQNRLIAERLERIETAILTSPDIHLRQLKEYLFHKIVITENPKDYVEFHQLYYDHKASVSEPIPKDAFASAIAFLFPQIKAKKRYSGHEFTCYRLKTPFDEEVPKGGRLRKENTEKEQGWK